MSEEQQAALEGWLEQLAGPTGSPGGGSAAALAVAMGAALVEMASGLGAKRKLLDEAARERSGDIAVQAAGLRAAALRLAHADAAAYSALVAAQREMKAVPGAASEAAWRRAGAEAADAPLRTGDVAMAVTELARMAVDYTPKGARTDLAVALLLLESAVAAALLNVEANLGDLDASDRAQREDRAQRLRADAAEIGALRQAILCRD